MTPHPVPAAPPRHCRAALAKSPTTVLPAEVSAREAQAAVRQPRPPLRSRAAPTTSQCHAPGGACQPRRRAIWMLYAVRDRFKLVHERRHPVSGLNCGRQRASIGWRLGSEEGHEESTARAAVSRCRACGARVTARQNFCGRCGAALQPDASGVPAHLRCPASRTPASRWRRSAKSFTILFADIAGSTALINDLDPEQAAMILDPVIPGDDRRRAQSWRHRLPHPG